MASVYADPRLRNKRHYIAASTFTSYVYGYSTTMNPNTFTTTGALTVLPSGTTTGKCPQGRILREVGNRLYPDAHPGISTMMVQVYDANSGIRGYIDPNAPVFAVYNSDKPVEIVDGNEVGTTTAHKGQPVFTTGDVIAGGQVRSYGVTALTSITTNGAQTAQNLDPSLGQVFTITSTPPSAPASITLNATSAPAGATLTLIIAHTGANATTFTFGTNMLSAGTFAPNSTASWTITFISDGTNFYEVARTTAQA